jgi:NAD(P)-dependent dehydrogenase (short-subunit alcohol dehydrogenase family)
VADSEVKTVVITGCSTGFGRATAHHLAKRGWQVLATVRKAVDQSRMVDEARDRGWQDRLRPVLCDVTKAADVAQLRRELEAATPRLEVLVNNAGTGFPGPLELLPLDDLRAQLEINLVAQLGVTQAMLPRLKEARGMILNISSIGGRIAYPLHGAYHMSKFALEAMSDALRVELAPFGVRVVVVQPGSSPTAIWETSMGRASGDQAPAHIGTYAPLAERVRRIALRGAGRGFPPEDFARLVERIVNSPRPGTRYAIGQSVRFYMWARKLLPDRVWDGLVRRTLNW